MAEGQKRPMTAAEKRAEALRLRRSRLGWRAIARQLGWKSHKSAVEAVRIALEEEQKSAALVASLTAVLEVDQLDELERNVRLLLQNAMGGGDARLADPALALQCTDRLLTIGRLRREVQSIAAPPREEEVDELEERRQRAKARLGLG